MLSMVEHIWFCTFSYSNNNNKKNNSNNQLLLAPPKQWKCMLGIIRALKAVRARLNGFWQNKKTNIDLFEDETWGVYFCVLRFMCQIHVPPTTTTTSTETVTRCGRWEIYRVSFLHGLWWIFPVSLGPDHVGWGGVGERESKSGWLWTGMIWKLTFSTSSILVPLGCILMTWCV